MVLQRLSNASKGIITYYVSLYDTINIFPRTSLLDKDLSKFWQEYFQTKPYAYPLLLVCVFLFNWT